MEKWYILNKRQIKKKWKKETPEEFQVCQYCGEKLNCFNKYSMRWGTCNSTCYGRLVGAEGYC